VIKGNKFFRKYLKIILKKKIHEFSHSYFYYLKKHGKNLID
jgi:hypothetical protein